MGMVIQKKVLDDGQVQILRIDGMLCRFQLPPEYLSSDGPIAFAHNVRERPRETQGFSVIRKSSVSNKYEGYQIKVGDKYNMRMWKSIVLDLEQAGNTLHDVNQSKRNANKECTDVI